MRQSPQVGVKIAAKIAPMFGSVWSSFAMNTNTEPRFPHPVSTVLRGNASMRAAKVDLGVGVSPWHSPGFHT